MSFIFFNLIWMIGGFVVGIVMGAMIAPMREGLAKKGKLITWGIRTVAFIILIILFAVSITSFYSSSDPSQVSGCQSINVHCGTLIHYFFPLIRSVQVANTSPASPSTIGVIYRKTTHNAYYVYIYYSLLFFHVSFPRQVLSVCIKILLSVQVQKRYLYS